MSPVLIPANERPVKRRRSEWRQSLVDAERGLAIGFRTDSTLYVYLFCDLLLGAIGAVLGLDLWSWLVIGLSCSFAFSLLLANLAISELLSSLAIELSRAAMVQRLQIAAVAIAVGSHWIVSGCLLWHRLAEIWPSENLTP